MTEILQELDDNRILAKFFWDLIRIFEEIDDHGILMKWNSYEILQGFWSEFWLSAIVSNNSDDYEILQEQVTSEFLWNSSSIGSEFFKN